jgi:fatty-acyl-CoA synthase
VAFVVLRKSPVGTTDALLEHCRAHLARYKVPREITVLEALPRNPSGKVLKRELRSG